MRSRSGGTSARTVARIEKEVAPKRPALHRAAKIGARQRDRARVVSPALETVEDQAQLVLDLARCFVDAVEHQGPAGRVDHRLADRGRVQAGAQIELAERSFPARRSVVHRTRGDVLADSLLAVDQRGRVRVRDLLELSEQPSHRLARADQAAEPHAVRGRVRHGDVRGEDLDARAAETDLGPRGDDHRLDPRVADEGSVGRLQVAHANALAHQRQLRVVSADRSVFDDEIGVGVAAEQERPRLEVHRPAALRPGDHAHEGAANHQAAARVRPEETRAGAELHCTAHRRRSAP